MKNSIGLQWGGITKSVKTSVVGILAVAAVVGGFALINPGHAAGPWYVSATSGNDANDCTSAGTACLTIQAAINKASAGDTVTVATGTYAEHVTINKALTLEGANSGLSCRGARGAESIITGTSSGAVQILANGVTLNGFQISSPSNALGSGVWMDASKSGALIKNNLLSGNQQGIYANSAGSSTISCNIFDANDAPGAAGGVGIYSENTNGLTIDSNEFKNHSTSNPVIFGATAAGVHQNLTFSNNLVHDNYSGIYILGMSSSSFSGNDIVAAGATALSFAGGNSNVTVTGNKLHDSARGVRFENGGYPGLGTDTNVHVNRNSLTGNSDYGAGNISLGHADPLDATCNWWGAASGPGPVGSGSGDKVTANVTFSPWLTSAGLASACNGAPVFIDTNVNHVYDSGEAIFPTIQAAVNAAVAGDTIQATAGNYPELVTVNKSVTVNGAQVGVDARSRSAATGTESIVGIPTGAFKIVANNVTIDGFTITGVTDASPAGLAAGIHTTSGNSGYTIKNNIIKGNIMGLYLNSASSTASRVEKNLLSANVAAGSASGNGIYSDQGLSNVTIDQNKFTGHTNTAINLSSAVSSNIVVDDNDMLTDGEILFSNVAGGSITNNTISTSTAHGIQLGGGNSNITVTGNSVRGSHDGWSGIRVNGGSVNSNITIRNNSLMDNDYGVNVTAADASNVTVNFNDLSNDLVSISYGVATTTLNAENNWFGCAAGPTSTTTVPTATSTCGIVIAPGANVDTNPWLRTLEISGNNPIVAQIHNSDSTSTAVGGNTGLKVKFTATNANPKPETIVPIGADNKATWNVDVNGPITGDTFVHGIVLFGDQDSTLVGDLTVNTPRTGGGSSGPPPNNGGGGGSSNPPPGQVLGASTSTVTGTTTGTITIPPATPPNLGLACTTAPYITTYMWRGKANNIAQVKRLQLFLNAEVGSTLPITGFFGPLTQQAVKTFQLKYSSQILAPWNITEPTGLVYKTTLWWINYLSCPNTAGPQPIVP